MPDRGEGVAPRPPGAPARRLAGVGPAAGRAAVDVAGRELRSPFGMRRGRDLGRCSGHDRLGFAAPVRLRRPSQPRPVRARRLRPLRPGRGGGGGRGAGPERGPRTLPPVPRARLRAANPTGSEPDGARAEQAQARGEPVAVCAAAGPRPDRPARRRDRDPRGDARRSGGSRRCRLPVVPLARRAESPEIAELLERPESPAGDPAGPGALPLLEDVVAPAANGDTEGSDRATGPRRTEAEETAAPLEHGPLPLDFEFIPDAPVPPIGDLDLDSPADGPDRERYGDAPPPSLDPEVYRHLIDRLANEIDVIVQTGTEEAMQRAAVEIAARVREHVAIILPEVIEGARPDVGSDSRLTAAASFASASVFVPRLWFCSTRHMETTYDPHRIESGVYAAWEEGNRFAPRGEGRPYCIMIPPPNVTGTLHMGHAFQDTIMGHPHPLPPHAGPRHTCGRWGPTTPGSRPRWWSSASSRPRARTGGRSAARRSSSGCGTGPASRAGPSGASFAGSAPPSTGRRNGSPWMKGSPKRCWRPSSGSTTRGLSTGAGGS